MKELYQIPEMELVKFDTEDCILASGDGSGSVGGDTEEEEI